MQRALYIACNLAMGFPNYRIHSRRNIEHESTTCLKVPFKNTKKTQHPPSSSTTCFEEGFAGEEGVSLLVVGAAARDWLRRSE